MPYQAVKPYVEGEFTEVQFDSTARRNPSEPYGTIPIELGYDALQVYQQYWWGQGDPLYAMMSRRGLGVDFTKVTVTEDELSRFESVTREILHNSKSLRDKRVAKAYLPRIKRWWKKAGIQHNPIDAAPAEIRGTAHESEWRSLQENYATAKKTKNKQAIAAAEKLLREFDVHHGLFQSGPQWKGQTHVRPEEAVLGALHQLAGERPAGTLLQVAELRSRLALPKATFDAAVLNLSKQHKATLHHHDAAGMLPPGERDALVKGPRNTYYVGIAPRASRNPIEGRTVPVLVNPVRMQKPTHLRNVSVIDVWVGKGKGKPAHRLHSPGEMDRLPKKPVRYAMRFQDGSTYAGKYQPRAGKPFEQHVLSRWQQHSSQRPEFRELLNRYSM